MDDVGNLTAKLTLNTAGFEKGLQSAEGMAQKLAGGIGNVLGGVTAAVTASVAAVATGVGKLVEESVKSYAEYEQLVGGVETLFKDSAGIIEDYAANAYKTAGISANEYMSTVTSFSASLIQSLGGDTEQAAEMADMAITDMADNANKMGSSMESIQNAYQGFAKGNFTMLDNLKLGYGGTQQEMFRLMEDAAKLDSKFAETADFALDSSGHLTAGFADMVEAIHIIQTEMGITGTTALEAGSTISGSFSMLKASWEDLLTSLSGGGIGLSQAIDNLISSAETFLTNIIPVVEEALYGIGDLIMEIVPIISERLPQLLATLVPKFVETAVYIVNALIQSLPQLISTIGQAIMGMIPDLTKAVIDMLGVLLTSVLPTIAEIAVELVLELGNGLVDNFDYLMKATLDLVFGIVDTIIAHLPEFLELGVKIVLKIAEGILMAIPRLIASVGKLLGIVDDTEQHIEEKTNNITTTVHSASISIDHSLNQTADSVRTYSGDVENHVESMGRSFDETFDAMLRTSEGFKRSTENTDNWVKEREVKIYDANGNVISSFNATTETIRAKSSSMQGISEQGQRYISAAMGEISSSAESAASTVENAVDRMNSALNSISSGNLNIGARAGGGPVAAGVPYMTGELGRELFIPATDGYIMDHDDTEDFLDSYGDRGGIYITINGDVYDDERSMKRKLKAAVLDVIGAEVAYG